MSARRPPSYVCQRASDVARRASYGIQRIYVPARAWRACYVGQRASCITRGPPVSTRGHLVSIRGSPVSTRGHTVSIRGPPVSAWDLLYQSECLLCRSEVLLHQSLHKSFYVSQRAFGINKRASCAGQRASCAGQRVSCAGQRASCAGQRASCAGQRASCAGSRASCADKKASCGKKTSIEGLLSVLRASWLGLLTYRGPRDSAVWLYRGPPVCTQGLLAMLRASYLYPGSSICSEGCMAVSFSESVPPQICGVAMPPQVCGWGGRLPPLSLLRRHHCPDSIRNVAYLFV